MRLLIAIMLQDYAMLLKQSRPLYLRWLLSIEGFWKAHPTRGILTFKFGPLVLVNFLLFPFLLCKSRRFNLVLEVSFYVPALLCLALLFFLVDIGFYFPLHLLSLLTPNKKSKNRCCLSVGTCLFCPCSVFWDVVNFVKAAFSSPSNYRLPPHLIYRLPTLRRNEVGLLLHSL